eukprot:gnl/Hemi2/14589_TR4947_c0_g1_i1.p1 gnl/Hemi2/14589_TR4947_c0_g1~~gnl/Hemi2/14589_TR4947_c0_g1_i1.p1  ORF type:complete len:139 (-),score=20.67 gnl/Hemi2/14589_TR4947_c0_g1_i1:641-1057(-)
MPEPPTRIPPPKLGLYDRIFGLTATHEAIQAAKEKANGKVPKEVKMIARLYAFKALLAGTGLCLLGTSMVVGLTAYCMGVSSVGEFKAKMKTGIPERSRRIEAWLRAKLPATKKKAQLASTAASTEPSELQLDQAPKS